MQVSDLLGFLFANLVPIVIVVSVIIRIYVSIKNAARKKAAPVPKPKQTEPEEPDAWRLEPDDDDDGIVPAIYTKPAPPPEAVPAFPLSVDPVTDPEPAAPSLPFQEAAAPGAAFAAVSHTGAAAPAGFFGRINALSPMRQAVVLAEILGPPKGME
jgi:hypothetical protein